MNQRVTVNYTRGHYSVVGCSGSVLLDYIGKCFRQSLRLAHCNRLLKGHCMGLNLPRETAKCGRAARGSTVSTKAYYLVDVDDVAQPSGGQNCDN